MPLRRSSARPRRAVVVEDAGHAVNFGRPDEFDRLLLEFLGDL